MHAIGINKARDHKRELALAIGKPSGTVSLLGINTSGLAYDPASDKSITAYKNTI
jgi:hypothetical protein